MVVTRSSAYNSSLKPAATSKSREIFTQSAKEAAIKSYKIYANASVRANTSSQLRVANTVAAAAAAAAVRPKPSPLPSPLPSSPILRRSPRNRKAVNYSENQKAYNRNDHDDDDDDVYDEEEAANALLSLNESPLSSSSSSSVHSDYNDDQDQHHDDNDDANTESVKHNQHCADNCVNPMTPIVGYAYGFTVSDPSQKQHYASCYMIYDEKTRIFHLLNKITLVTRNLENPSEPILYHSVLTKYSTYSTMSVQAYILNILATPQHRFCISAQFVGLILSDDKLRSLYDANACYYDIDSLMNTRSSTETLTGREIFILTPPTQFSNETFTDSHIQSVFNILTRNN